MKMAVYKLSTKWKKSIVQTDFWVNSDGSKRIEEEIGWRWGYVTFESDEEPEIDLDNPDGISVYDEFEVLDSECNDGCWQELTFVGFTEEEENEMREWIEENSVYDLEEDGWIMSDSETEFQNELELEKIED
jgi:hypothetical protein